MKKEDAVNAEMAAAGHAGDGNEYTAYVYYEFEIQ